MSALALSDRRPALGISLGNTRHVVDEPDVLRVHVIAETVCFVLTQPGDTVIPELTVLPMRETSWP